MYFRWNIERVRAGHFHFSATYTADRSAFPCPPGAAPFDNFRFNVVEGSGLMFFDDLCGSAIVTDEPRPTFAVDWILRFGRACKATTIR